MKECAPAKMLLKTLLFSIICLFILPTVAFPDELADLVVVIKSKRVMLLMKEGKIIKAYRIALGKNPMGKKINKGDGKTPEGRYFIIDRNPNSNFHKSLRISYPNEKDFENARRKGLHPGGDIAIHGLSKRVEYLGKYHIIEDWTEGCIAVTNEEIEEMWRLVHNGTPIEILP
jgi:murein L,D-transpeptidase YafK